MRWDWSTEFISKKKLLLTNNEIRPVKNGFLLVQLVDEDSVQILCEVKLPPCDWISVWDIFSHTVAQVCSSPHKHKSIEISVRLCAIKNSPAHAHYPKLQKTANYHVSTPLLVPLHSQPPAHLLRQYRDNLVIHWGSDEGVSVTQYKPEGKVCWQNWQKNNYCCFQTPYFFFISILKIILALYQY